ncbi:hypothetical protein C8J57DRAFT_1494405 [Mycena rebaudengoi]|nr:hypothetical protein C8J57DRAFT_1494405 [Mycena rebaudengoi]
MSGMVTFEAAWTLALSEVIKSGVALFFTGICILLAVIAVYFLRRRGAPGHHAFSCALGVMCLLAIGQTVLHIFSAVWVLRIAYSAAHGKTADPVQRLDYLVRVNDRIFPIENTLFWINNFVADSVFVRFLSSNFIRFKIKIITVPVVLLLVTTVLGLVKAYSAGTRTESIVSPIGAGFAIVTNMVLTGLTAGRIWWTRRYLRIVDKTAFVKRYNTAATMIIESGAAYLFFAILVVIAASVLESSSSPINQWWCGSVSAACGQLMNFIPMLVIVRISLGHSVEVETADRELAQVSPALI